MYDINKGGGINTPFHYGMNIRIVWPGDGACGTENALLFNDLLWKSPYNLGCEVNKK